MRSARVILAAAGLAAIGYGAYGSVVEDRSHLLGHVAFLLGVLVAHDLVLLPLAIGVGWVTGQFLPARARPYVQSGLYASAVVTAVALAFLLGRGRLPDNPSKFPLNYGRGLLIVLGVVWLVVGLLLVVRHRRQADGSGPA